MKDNNLVSWIGSGITLLTSALSTDIAQLVLLILGCVSTLVSLAYNIYKWYKKAKADGRIDEKEIDELKDIIDDHTKGNDNDTK